MAKEQTQPRLIFWEKEEGVFRAAKPKMSENYLGYDLERNIELGSFSFRLGEDIQYHSSIYLGPINISEEQTGDFMNKQDFERLRQHRHGTVYGIVQIAEKVAKGQGVPYFAINVVSTEKDRTWRFTEREDWLKEPEDWLKKSYEKYSSLETSDKPKKPLEFVLHPTAQLYVPKK